MIEAKKIIIKLIVISFVIFLSVGIGLASFEIWHRTSDGIRDNIIKSICFEKDNSLIGYSGSGRAIYKTVDGGKYWKEILGIRGDDTAVNFLIIDKSDSNIVYAATGNGLYSTNNKAKTWQRIFQGKNELEKNCLSLALDKEKIYLGTKDGLFISNDRGKIWMRQSGEISNLEVSSIVVQDNLIYLATFEGIFKSEDSGNNFKKVYSIFYSKDVTDQQINNETEEIASTSKIRQIILDTLDNQKIYFASDKGVFASLDKADSWRRLSSAGLISSNVNSIFILNNQLFAGTDEGVFEFDQEKWNQRYQGLSAQTINFICKDAKDNLWLATDKGVYKMNFATDVPLEKEVIITKSLIDNFKDEPSIQRIQQEAIKYADVQPEKIQSWRRAAAKKAWLPEVSIGADGDKNRTISDNVWGSYTSGGQSYVGADDKTFYNNFSWDVSLSWDLGELVWNPDQTSIDSRSKLMVELRDDILNEVTRLYFERRRIQIELSLTPPKDTNEKVEKTLRLAELTASIDALTGGYLSRMLKAKDTD